MWTTNCQFLLSRPNGEDEREWMPAFRYPGEDGVYLPVRGRGRRWSASWGPRQSNASGPSLRRRNSRSTHVSAGAAGPRGSFAFFERKTAPSTMMQASRDDIRILLHLFFCHNPESSSAGACPVRYNPPGSRMPSSPSHIQSLGLAQSDINRGWTLSGCIGS